MLLKAANIRIGLASQFKQNKHPGNSDSYALIILSVIAAKLTSPNKQDREWAKNRIRELVAEANQHTQIL